MRVPAGKPWLASRPALTTMGNDEPYWRVFDNRYPMLEANPKATSRMALLDTHGSFFVADTLAGALWEVALRYTQVTAGWGVEIPVGKLRHLRATKVRLTRADVPLLDLGHPGLMALHPLDSPEAQAIDALMNDPMHKNTHAPARDLHAELQAMGIVEMPVIAWDSRQYRKSKVFLAYDPPMTPSWWQPVGEVIALDDPESGYPVLQAELAQHGFIWTPPAATSGAVPP